MLPEAKPVGETQAENPPMGRGPGRQDYSSPKTAGKGTGVTDHSRSPLYPPPPPPHPPATEPWVTNKLTP